MTMQVSTFAVNYQVCLGRVFAMDESSVWPLHVLPSSRVVPVFRWSVLVLAGFRTGAPVHDQLNGAQVPVPIHSRPVRLHVLSRSG